MRAAVMRLAEVHRRMGEEKYGTRNAGCANWVAAIGTPLASAREDSNPEVLALAVGNVATARVSRKLRKTMGLDGKIKRQHPPADSVVIASESVCCSATLSSARRPPPRVLLLPHGVCLNSGTCTANRLFSLATGGRSDLVL
jgi:hypothetical protein